MTAEEFERAYAARSGVSVEELRQYRTVRPCACGEPECEGWQSISHERAAEWDAANEGSMSKKPRWPKRESTTIIDEEGRPMPLSNEAAMEAQSDLFDRSDVLAVVLVDPTTKKMHLQVLVPPSQDLVDALRLASEQLAAFLKGS